MTYTPGVSLGYGGVHAVHAEACLWTRHMRLFVVIVVKNSALFPESVA